MLLAAFALIESRHRAPLVPLRLLRSRTLVGANLVMLLFGTVAFGMPFILTLYAQQVLGYSAIKFGLGTAVFAVMAAVGSIVGQAIVLRVGFRPVAATGMALMGAGSLLLTQVSVGGSYFGDIFFGLLVFGPGIGLAFVTATVAALAGVAERESGLASGLSNTAFQIGAGARRRHRHDGCRLPLRGLPGGERRCEPARRADRGLPVRLPGLRRAGRDRRGAGALAARPAAPKARQETARGRSRAGTG